TGGSSLPKDDIERMMREAEQYAEEDHKRREAAETRNQAEQLVHQTERLLADTDDGAVPAETRSEVAGALDDLRARLAETPENPAQAAQHTTVLRQAVERTTAAAQRVGTAMYARAKERQEDVPGSAGGRTDATQPGEGQDGAREEDVVDAEVVDDEPGSDEPKGGPASGG
ncbi:molecular chaperone DnaK, partial [Streptomyces reniochalinae]